MDVYFSPKALKFLKAQNLITTRKNGDGILLGHKRGLSFFVEDTLPTSPGFFSSLEKYYALNAVFDGRILGFYSFFPEENKTKRILAPFALGKLFLEIEGSESNGFKIKPYSIEYEKSFYLSPLRLSLSKSERRI